jgi:hypothetical protein
VSLHERVLGGLLGIGGVAADDVGGAEGDVLVAGDERAVGIEVPGPRAGDQRLVVLVVGGHQAQV